MHRQPKNATPQHLMTLYSTKTTESKVLPHSIQALGIQLIPVFGSQPQVT